MAKVAFKELMMRLDLSGPYAPMSCFILLI